jgi:FlaG/FlaF family flagellin (archaellin)
LKLPAITSLLLILAALSGVLSLGSSVAASSPQATTSVSFIVTTTSNYPVTTGGPLQVFFDSIELTTTLPQAYTFNIKAKTMPGFWITHLLWQFGDGSILDVPYCCQSYISEVRYHAYAQHGSYTVMVAAYDNAGNFGNAVVTVNWTVPAPEFPLASLSMVASLIIVLAAAALMNARTNRIQLRL